MDATSNRKPPSRSDKARRQALQTAAHLFYRHGARAVGMDQIVDESGVAKTTIYRHFPTKDDLIAAFVEQEDLEFWGQWDNAQSGSGSAAECLFALCDWISARVVRDGYRGCPQINIAAEFAEANHPARIVAARHKQEMHRRLTELCRRMGVEEPDVVAMQIALIFDGAFASNGQLTRFNATQLLRKAVRQLL